MEIAIRLAYDVKKKGTYQDYDCEICYRRGDYKKQACYKHRPVNPVRLVRPSNFRYDSTGYDGQLNKRQVWRLVEDMERWWPEQHILFHLRVFLGVCPQGLISGELDEHITMEMMCETYKVGPVPGGLDDWPALMQDAFRVIRRTHIAVQNEQAKEAMERVGNK